MAKGFFRKLQAPSKRTKINTKYMMTTTASSNEQDTLIEMHRFTRSYYDEFFQRITAIAININTIQNNNETMRKLRGRVLYGINQQQVEKSKSELYDIVALNKRLGVLVRDTLTKEQIRVDDKAQARAKTAGRKRTPTEGKELMTERRQIAVNVKKFYDVWSNYNIWQLEYRDRLKNLLKSRGQITGSEILTYDEIIKLLDQDESLMFNALILKYSKEEHILPNQLEDLYSEFLILEQSIQEVHDFLLELEELVVQQYDLVSNLSYSTTLEEDELSKTTKKAKGAEQKKQFTSRRET